ncbi:hypothetical protein CAP36_09225 [Chitinophagaceae bacterium IBVUCB2]|nr:hypothetical protein CAP36_09225 [Chitinophagaceae bacterium IBVUCB2]
MIKLKYWNEALQIAMADWKTVYQFPERELMIKEIHQGNLYYRRCGSNQRISYRQLKKGLQKKEIIIYEELNLLPF